MSAPHAPAGWYPDPTNRGGQRYWNGTSWTEQTNPNPPPRFATTPAAVGAMPWWQTWWAVVPALIVLAPLGLVGLWMRKGPSPRAKWIISVATALFVVVVLASSQTKTTPADKAPTAAPTMPPVQLVSVPALTGETVARARAELTAMHLTVGLISREQSAQPAGTVLDENPSTGSQAAAGSAIDIVIAAPRPRVPRVIGEPQTTATRRLTAAGFTVIVVRHTISSGTNGVVLSQSPNGGAFATSGTGVRIVVAHLVVPPHAPPPPPPAAPSCTTTSSGTCIRGGEFCPQADYGMTGYDAYGRSYTCTGDTTHPHWE